MNATIYLIRHGQTVWNRSGRLQGQADSPLTAQGLRQCEAVGHALMRELGPELAPDLNPGPDNPGYHFWASPLGRTRQSAAIISEVIGHAYDAITFDDRLQEITLGTRDGYQSWQALSRDFPEEMARREGDPWNYQHPEGESSQMVQDRVRPLLTHWQQVGGTHIVVSHGVAIKILRGLHRDLSPEETFALDRPQDGFYRLEEGAEIFIPAAPLKTGPLKTV